MISCNLNLEKVIHYYNSERYDEAISELTHLMNSRTQKSAEENAIIDFWFGKSFFFKFEHSVISYTTFSLSGRINRAQVRHCPIQKRMLKKSLGYLNSALELNPKFSDAYYWKGKILNHEKKIGEAFSCFAKAAALSGNVKYRKKCLDYFSKYTFLPFIETVPLNSITRENALNSCSSPNPYIRMEACQYLLAACIHEEKNIAKLIQAVSPLAGYWVCYSPIPFTGDKDKRVRKIAQSICQLYE